MGHFQCQIGMQKGCTEIKPAAVGRTDGKGVGMDFQAVRLGIGCRRCFPDVRGGFLKRLRPGHPVADAQGRELLSVTGRLRFSCLPDGDKGGALTLGDNLNQRKAIRGLYFFVKFSAIMCCMCCNFVV